MKCDTRRKVRVAEKSELRSRLLIAKLVALDGHLQSENRMKL